MFGWINEIYDQFGWILIGVVLVVTVVISYGVYIEGKEISDEMEEEDLTAEPAVAMHLSGLGFMAGCSWFILLSLLLIKWIL